MSAVKYDFERNKHRGFGRIYVVRVFSALESLAVLDLGMPILRASA